MQRVLAHVLAAVSMSLLVIAVTSTAVFAEANPNNRGHHYGQLKHQKVAPGNPTPNGPPQQTAVNPAPPASPALAIHLPVVKLAPVVQASAKINAVSRRAPVDPWWWLVVLLPPALVGIWIVAARRLAVAASTAAKPEPVPSPA